MNGQTGPDAPDEFETRSKAEFDASVGELNANIRSRLTQARFAAVAELEHRNRRTWQRMWMPAAGLAATALIVAMVVVPGMQRAKHAGVTLADDDIPILMGTDNVEMIEDIEFYAWLDSESLDDDSTAEPAGSPPDEPARS